MAFVPVPHGARAVLNFALGSQAFSNVLHFTKPGFDTDDMDQLADLLDAKILSDFIPILSNDCTYVNVTVYDVRTIDGQVVTNSDNAGNGTDANDVLPLNAALCVTLRTNDRGRSARGRMYLSGLSKINTYNGAFLASVISAAEDYVTAIRTNAAAAGWTLVIASFQEDGVLLEIANTRAVTSHLVRSGEATSQRRRVDRI